MNISEIDRLHESYRNWADSAIMRGDLKRQMQWTESIAVGDMDNSNIVRISGNLFRIYERSYD